MVTEIIKKHCAHAKDERRRAAFKFAVSDSLGGMFSAIPIDQECLVGPKNRNGARMRSAVAEKTAEY